MYFLSWVKEPAAPVLSRRGGWRIKGDVWLAGAWERRLVSSLVRKYFNLDPGFENDLVVFHRVPSWSSEVDYAFEFHAHALRLGVAYYSVKEGWSLSPTGALASLLESQGAQACDVGFAGHLKGKQVELPEECAASSNMVLLRMGGYVGVARRTGGGRRFKVKDAAPRGFRKLAQGGAEDVVSVNQQVLKESVREAKAFIVKAYRSIQGSGKAAVSFSGGADSTATLFLAAEALGPGKVVAVYSDTGLEFPESLRYAEQVASRLGVELVVLEPSARLVDLVGEKGLMSVDDRWCTRILKLEPLRKFYSSSGLKLYFDGARDYESFNRARTPRLGYNPLIPGVKRALPIKQWPRLLVQAYLYSVKTPLNPLYDQGFTRIGCVACPAMHLYELHLSFSKHRGIHEELAKAAGVSMGDYLRMRWSTREPGWKQPG